MTVDIDLFDPVEILAFRGVGVGEPVSLIVPNELVVAFGFYADGMVIGAVDGMFDLEVIVAGDMANLPLQKDISAVGPGGER